ncbi:peptidoglycan-binding protein [Spirosoma endbachense]|uniref:Peptidoglycan-binding protein n=1 Tax=Spirosoma endbachense TaxID=2666025 RepID=A0A6P1VVB9_9BACT|nr:peptidoglycan-binding protein [Spirosoma endbachense]QHV97161.1 peptidoglycan-binding protein [Spirosoma endbachense]
MIKTSYQNELLFSDTLKKGSQGPDVRRIQEWLCLSALRYPQAVLTTAIDGQFGPATERALQNFQAVLKLPKTGIVTSELFARLSAPLSTAFQAKPTINDTRKAVIQVAKAHLNQRSAEIQTDDGQNLGPWVRGYCDGFDGAPFKWCVGFVQTVLDQVASAQGRSFTSIMPQTLSCDTMALSGKENGRLLDSTLIRKKPDRIQIGDVFILRNPQDNDWFHTGIITAVLGDAIETLEGNTDLKGGSNGTAVFARVRNIQKATIDVFSIDGL